MKYLKSGKYIINKGVPDVFLTSQTASQTTSQNYKVCDMDFIVYFHHNFFLHQIFVINIM